MKNTVGIQKWVARLVGLCLAGAASGISAQTWKYQGAMFHEGGGPATPGQMTLQEAGGGFRLQLTQANWANCYKSPLTASVERTQSTITITTSPMFAGCAQNRFVLNTDGSEGFREYLHGGEWFRDASFRLEK